MRRSLSMWLSCAVTALLCGGCGPGVFSLLHPGEPLVRLRAEVVTVGEISVPSSGIEAALMWASIPPQVEACLAVAQSVHDVLACTGGDLRPQLTSTTVAVEPDFPNAFELPLHALPPEAALTGTPAGRLAYGIVVVHHDRDENHRLDLVPPEGTEGPDVVLGTSLRTHATVEGDYVAFREGEVPGAWNLFRVLGGCPDPPTGFFLVRLRRTTDGLVCSLDAPAKPITVELSDTPAVRARACQHRPPPPPRQPQEAPAAGGTLQCWGAESLEVISHPEATCLRPERYDLVGCPRGASSCATPQWDLRSEPPAWWPCTTGSARLTLRDLDEPLDVSEPLDHLFLIDFVEGLGAFEMKEVSVVITVDEAGTEVVLTTPDPTVIAGLPTFDLEDRDGDRRFSPGDSLTIREQDAATFNPTTLGVLDVRVQARAEDGRTVVLGTPLSWTPQPLPPPRTDVSLAVEQGRVPLTQGADCLFTVRHLAGPPLDPARLRVKVDAPDGVETLFTGTSLRLLDGDADGLLSAGDGLDVCELQPVTGLDASASGRAHTVALQIHAAVHWYQGVHAEPLRWVP